MDDNTEHLNAIVRSLRVLGAHSQGIHWDPLKSLEPRDFRRVRGLFLDLQLLENIATTDYKRHYANIQTILEDCISETGGPFVVILWTSAGDKAEELRKYLLENIPDEVAYARPIAVIPLPKNEYISLADGVELTGADLIGAVKKGLASLPAFASLMQWEFEVQEASSVVLSHLLGTEFLHGDDEDRGQRVADYLLRLASEAVGVSNVEGAERVAIHSALLPLLSDEIQNAAPEASDSAQWTLTFSDRSDTPAKLSVAEAAALNSRLHLASSAGNGIVPSEWGAMTLLPRGFFWPIVGHPDRSSWLEKSLNLKPALTDDDKSKVKIYKVRVGAACDYAQRRRAPVPFALCAAVPAKTGSNQRSLNANSNNWLSPLISMDSVPCQLVIDPSMVFTQQPEIASIGSATYRLREQILMEIVNKISGYGSRPGMIRFNA